ncbi:MAG: GerMN domain-containing protein [Armatimonadetes bacterium]|nr:GerMN domain-containing protein [Armatimonadota bacterium]
MSRRSRRFRNTAAIVLLAATAFVAAAAVTFYIRGGFRGEKPKGTVRISRPPVVTLTEQRRIIIYLPRRSKKGVCLAPQVRSTDSKGSKLDVALSALLTAGQGKGEAAGLIPEGAKLCGPVKVKGEVAIVDLSKEFLENFSGGTMQEALTLNAIVHTVVDNSDGKVKRVKILVEGEPVETLGGAFELTEPISADSTLLRPVGAN